MDDEQTLVPAPDRPKNKGGRPLGSKNKPHKNRPIPRIVTADAKATNNALTKLIGDHFQTQATVHNYLDKLARDHVATYISLVAKTVPQSVAVDITHHAIDLGAAMADATQRLRAYRAGDDLPIIDLVPNGSETTEKMPMNRVKMAEISEKLGGGRQGGHPGSLPRAEDCGPDPDTVKIFREKILDE